MDGGREIQFYSFSLVIPHFKWNIIHFQMVHEHDATYE